NAIAQTPDGYLWLGTDFGLVRFDGVRAVPWQPPRNQSLPSDQVVRLLAAKDGTLWIGTRSGLVSWKDGALTRYSDLEGAVVGALLEDHQGSIWATGLWFGRKDGVMCVITAGRATCGGNDDLGRGAFGLYEDRERNLWVGALQGRLLRWAPGPPQLFRGPRDVDGIQGFAEDDRAGLLMTSQDGLARFVGGRAQLIPLPGIDARAVRLRNLLRDRDGALWMTSSNVGLVHLHRGHIDRFIEADGLSG